MDSMQQPEGELLASLQDNVSRKVGRCILRLQQYELLMKRLLAAHDRPPLRDSSAGLRTAAPTRGIARLASNNLDHPLADLGAGAASQAKTDALRGASQPSLRLHRGGELSDDDYQKAKQDLAALVARRNHLVHHFMQQFELFSTAGCHAAELYLDETYQQIDQHDRELRAWTKGMEHGLEHSHAFMQSTTWRDVLLYGLVPGQPVDWPGTTIVQQLTLAESTCHEAGWTSLAAAIGFIHRDWPELNPKKYGCRSWRHVIHQSGLFEIQKRKPADSERTQVWYRSKPALG
ncbi:MAG: OST-HTH/LOTUS domain-containing protein [Pseudomonadaceae bacterium]|nr:OST-HTH/LOTUS domain-containing protein [Pseudomonadaceae bacterium]